jgi:FtsP/CotA-like multicopper oxidase with cupredoxin domain
MTGAHSLNRFAAQIHWHGIHQRQTPYSDGFPTLTQCPIPAGSEMQYEFIADPPGPTFWHAHFHAMTVDGMHGPLIVEDEPGTFPFHYDEERVILLSDEYHNTSWQIEDYLDTPDPNGSNASILSHETGLLCLYDETNPASVTSSCSRGPTGEGFNLNFEPGKVYRLRVICASLVAGFVFSIDQHQLQLVSADFSTLDGSTWVDGIPLFVSLALRTFSP